MAADNVAVTAGTGTSVRTFSDGMNEWQAVVPAYVTGGSAGAWTLQQVDSTHPLPVNCAQTGSWSVAALQSGTWTVQPGNTANTTPWLVTPSPATSGGPTAARVKAAASTNATSVKASAGQLYGYALFNNNASARYFKLYNKASAPTVGTDTPFATIIIPANSGANVEFSLGVPMGTGIAYAITGGVADTDATAVSVDDVHGLLLYK